jgi:hypothetical protein
MKPEIPFARPRKPEIDEALTFSRHILSIQLDIRRLDHLHPFGSIGLLIFGELYSLKITIRR